MLDLVQKTPPDLSRRSPAIRSTEKLAIACLSLMMLMASLGSSVANAALPTLAKSLDASFQSAQWIVLAYLLAVTTLVVSVGRLSDTVGCRRLLIVGIALFTVASVLCSLAPTLTLLIASRALQGVGAAVMMALSLAMVSQTVSKEKLGSAMGVLGAMSAVGTALGPSLGGIVTASAGWRYIFVLSTPIGILGVVMTVLYLPADEKNRKGGKGFDLWGTLLLGIGLAAYSLVLTTGKDMFGPTSLVLVFTALAASILFVTLQKRVLHPLVPLEVFGDRKVTSGLLANLLVSAVIMSTLIVGPFYLAGSLHLDASAVGVVLTVGPVVVALFGFPSGRLADRYGAQRLAVWGLIAIGAGALLLSSLPLVFGLAGYLAPIVLIAAGYAGFQTANNTVVMGRAGADRRGVLSGMLNLSRNLGLVTGASLMGAVFAAASGASTVIAANPEQVDHGFRATFAVAALLILIALGVSSSRSSSPSPRG